MPDLGSFGPRKTKTDQSNESGADLSGDLGALGPIGPGGGPPRGPAAPEDASSWNIFGTPDLTPSDLGRAALGAPQPEEAEWFKQRFQQERDLSDWRTQRLKSLTGGQFEPGEAITDPFERADLVRSNRYSEQRQKYLADHPEGEFYRVPLGYKQGSAILARPSKDQPLREVRAPGMDTGTLGDVGGALVSEPAAGTLIGFGLGGPFGAAAGAGAGSLLQNRVEEWRGYQEDPFYPDQLQQAGTEAGLALAGEAVPGLGSRLLNAMRTTSLGGFVRLRRGVEDVAEAAAEEGLPAPKVGQVAESPLTTGVLYQAAGLDAKTQRRLREQPQAVYERLRREVDEQGFNGLSDAELEQLMIMETRKLDDIIKRTPMDRERGAEAIDQGVTEWLEASRRLRDRAYNQALNLSREGDVYFDVSDAKSFVQRVERGTPTRREPYTKESGLVDEQGNKLTFRVEDDTIEIKRRNLPKELQNAMDTLRQMDPTVRNLGEVSGIQQLKDLRTDLFDVMNNDNADPGARRIATQLWGKLKGAMENPITENQQFLQAYRNAAQLHASREGIRELKDIKPLLRGDMASMDKARKFFQPNVSAETLQTLQRILPKRRWEQFREAAKMDILAEGAKEGSGSGGRAILNKLDRYRQNPRALRTIFNDREIDAIKAYGRQLEAFDQGFLRRTLNKELDEGERAVQLARSNPEQLRQVINEAGGKNSEVARAARAGFWYDVIKNAKDLTPEGADTISPQALRKALTQMDDIKLDAFMRDSDKRLLDNMKKYISTIARAGDIGGAMMEGTLRSQITNPMTFVSAAIKTRRMQIMARILSSDVARNQIWMRDTLGGWASAAAVAANELSRGYNPQVPEGNDETQTEDATGTLGKTGTRSEAQEPRQFGSATQARQGPAEARQVAQIQQGGNAPRRGDQALNNMAKVTPGLLDAVRQVESSGGKNLYGPWLEIGGERTRALGPYQILPSTARDYGVEDTAILLNEETARPVARKILRDYIGMFDGDVEKGLAAYNWGPGNLRRAIRKHGDNWREHLPDETSGYLQKITSNMPRG